MDEYDGFYVGGKGSGIEGRQLKGSGEGVGIGGRYGDGSGYFSGNGFGDGYYSGVSNTVTDHREDV